VANDIGQRARARFAQLRGKAQEEGPPGGPFGHADGWCISAISRMAVSSPDVVSTLGEVQSQLTLDPTVWLYPVESLHISLLGCTPREEGAQAADGERARRIADAVEEVAESVGPVGVTLGAVNAIGVQLFVEAVPDDSRWADARLALEDAVRALGEEPMSYADPEPMHLNVARYRAEPSRESFEHALRCAPPDGVRVELTALETVITDFLVSPETLQVVDTSRL
jgi:hypothetical protein